MKSKVTEWGNSHGIRITSAMMDHLNVSSGENVDINITDQGIEIIKNDPSIEYIKAVDQEVLDAIIEKTDSVKQVNDPYVELDVGYLIIAINPCKPIIREVPKGTPDSSPTLADAKEVARQILQTAIAEAKDSLSELRQLGIDNISYVAL